MSPRTSLLVLTYNQRLTARAAVESCLGQQGEALEVVLSDDASTDGTHELLKQLAVEYDGPHHVRVRRNPSNLGIGDHYNQAVAACSGQLIVTAAGDDISLPHRVQSLVSAWDAGGQRADLVASHLLDMEVDGQIHGVIRVDDLSQWQNADDWVAKRPRVVGASHAFTRRMFDRFGPIRSDLPYEDQIMALRASCMGGGITVDEPLVRYRRGGVSAGVGGQLSRTANLQRLRIKHTRQQALYMQVEQDLAVAGRSDLWPGSMRGKLQQSQLVLAMVGATSWRERLWLLQQVRHHQPDAGLFWAALQAFRLPWPH